MPLNPTDGTELGLDNTLELYFRIVTRYYLLVLLHIG